MEQVAATLVTGIVPRAVRDAQPLHGRREVRLLRTDQQVVMVAHEHIRIHAQREALRALSQSRQKPLVIPPVAEDRTLLVATVEHVVERILLVDAQRPCHAAMLPRLRSGVN